MPKLYIISGCNGSGKTTASYTLLPDLLGYSEFVNSDEFAKSLSPFDPSAVSITASRYMLMKINYLLGRLEDFSIETTLATRSLVKIIDEAHSLGYEVTILYFWLNSPELAIQRVKDRVAAGGAQHPGQCGQTKIRDGVAVFLQYIHPHLRQMDPCRQFQVPVYRGGGRFQTDYIHQRQREIQTYKRNSSSR